VSARTDAPARALSPLDRALLGLLAVGMVAIGATHFTTPEPFVRIVPPWLPAPRALVYVSGFFEIAGGLGVLLPATRKAAAWGLVALFVCVFPANVYMATSGVQPLPDQPVPEWAAWARLPFQLVFVAWAHRFTRDRSTRDGSAEVVT
jgi:uncharacterized membrane protein